MNLFVRFDEIPSMALQDIKETKYCRRMEGWMQAQCEESIPSTNTVCRGYKDKIANIYQYLFVSLYFHSCNGIFQNLVQDGFVYFFQFVCLVCCLTIPVMSRLLLWVVT